MTALALQEAPDRPYDVLTADANTDDWLRLRKLGIGASEAAAVLGQTSWGTPLSVWQDKTSPAVEDQMNDLMEFGHLAEPLIVEFMARHPERFRFIGEIIPSEGLLRSRQYPWLLGTLDRQVITPEGLVVPLELKSVNDHMAREWVSEGFEGGTVGEVNRFGQGGSRYVVPPKYQVQVQQQMAVTGSPYAYVAAWLGKAIIELIRVERDEEFIQDKLVGHLGAFWTDHVQTGVAPAPNLLDNLWEIWPGETGKQIVADVDAREIAFMWRRAGVDKREAEREYKERAFTLATFMQDATELVDPETGKVIHTLRPTKGRAVCDLAMLQKDYPNAYEACVSLSAPSRTHRATKEPIEIG